MLKSEPCRGDRQAGFFRVKASLRSNEFTSLWKSNLWKLALLVNQREQVAGFHSQEVQDLLVVAECDGGPGDAFSPVLLLLLLEDVTHEELLQLLVSKVHAQLLEAVRRSDICSVFKAAIVFLAKELWGNVLTCFCGNSQIQICQAGRWTAGRIWPDYCR